MANDKCVTYGYKEYVGVDDMQKIILLGTQSNFINGMNEICACTRSKINFCPNEEIQNWFLKQTIVGYKTAFNNFIMSLPLNWFHFKLQSEKNYSFIVDNQARLRLVIDHKNKEATIARRFDYNSKSFLYEDKKCPTAIIYIYDGGREAQRESIEESIVKELYMKAGRDLDKLNQLVFEYYDKIMTDQLPEWKDSYAYWEI